ncbi:hypothetical protein CC1G_04694 [Coprinopsis cinerea okayama7|uniref:Serine hydrolase domain-containing protein n=1 Tax=Coprinopsis cinerea (strain Okayama-7 / 130 / ATCC MYA-4618 / FGSC 9003) TaxID=240176 RepID=A8N4Z4_COPC7|nr:hypothetical protein CC1G_04694 [Coprinopsis cinerea okayama7\|eukprot:XP_001830005.2 hypothetical protein CC1G_04694 [Coprinopsis cinerea okayama7\
MSKKTVLVLHGYSQNSTIFSKRIGALRKECGKKVDFVFIDAPHILQPADLVFNSSRLEELGLRAEVQANEAAMADDPTLTPRAWWKPNPERTKATGIEESIMSVREVLMSRKFDGVFGFSQGAAFAALISALLHSIMIAIFPSALIRHLHNGIIDPPSPFISLERPEAYPPFLVDGKAPHPPFDFCVAVSGFKVSDPICEPIWGEDGFSTPTLHVIGKTDVVVVEERSRALLAISKNPRLEEHVGGHFVPSKAPWRKFLAAYLSNSSGDVPSPSVTEAASSEASSTVPSRSETPQANSGGGGGNQTNASLTMKL